MSQLLKTSFLAVLAAASPARITNLAFPFLPLQYRLCHLVSTRHSTDERNFKVGLSRVGRVGDYAQTKKK